MLYPQSYQARLFLWIFAACVGTVAKIDADWICCDKGPSGLVSFSFNLQYLKSAILDFNFPRFNQSKLCIYFVAKILSIEQTSQKPRLKINPLYTVYPAAGSYNIIFVPDITNIHIIYMHLYRSSARIHVQWEEKEEKCQYMCCMCIYMRLSICMHTCEQYVSQMDN